MRKKIKDLLILALMVMVIFLLFLFFRGREPDTGQPIKVSGNIEGDDVRISFRVPGKILKLLTDEGEVIKTGQPVALLDTDELTKIRDEALASLKAAEFKAALAAEDYIRAENLLAAGAISQQKRDRFKTQADSSMADVQALRASLELAETRLGYANLQAPLDGYVLVKTALAGEVVQAGAPVFTAIDLQDIWVTAYINETDLGRVKLGQKAHVVTDSFRDKRYDGWVSFISSEAEFTPKYIQTTEERVKLVFRIKVRADNRSLELRPGMPADAYIIEN